MLDCWRENTTEGDWRCETEEVVDISDGAKVRQQRWIVSNTQRLSFSTVQSVIVRFLINFINKDVERITKELYINVTLDEWVEAYNIDSGKKNDPEEIEKRIFNLLM